MKTIAVTARKRDARAYGVQKYDNRAAWNKPGGIAPNGVSATRYLRDTTPDITLLFPLAAWLVAHLPEYCGGQMPHPQIERRVLVYNGRSEAEQIMHDAQTTQTVNGIHYNDPADAIRHAEGLLKVYARSLDGPQVIDGWLFDIIEPNQTDEEYWNQQAAKMLAAGTVLVVIGNSEWKI
jgi:hypothetical protein